MELLAHPTQKPELWPKLGWKHLPFPKEKQDPLAIFGSWVWRGTIKPRCSCFLGKVLPLCSHSAAYQNVRRTGQRRGGRVSCRVRSPWCLLRDETLAPRLTFSPDGHRTGCKAEFKIISHLEDRSLCVRVGFSPYFTFLTPPNCPFWQYIIVLMTITSFSCAVLNPGMGRTRGFLRHSAGNVNSTEV